VGLCGGVGGGNGGVLLYLKSATKWTLPKREVLFVGREYPLSDNTIIVSFIYTEVLYFHFPGMCTCSIS